MGKKIAAVLAALLLSGCGTQETFETVLDDFAEPVLASVRQMYVILPPEAASPVLESETGVVYVCEDYEIHQQVLPSGDLSATVKEVSGYDLENLTMVSTRQEDCKRYDFVWVAASDQGEQIGKGCILDDGSHHYALTVLGKSDTAGAYESVWWEILNSFSLG